MGLRHQGLEMSWQPSLLSEKRKRGPPLGLRNLGNSCYLNSVLQCLTYTPPLANFCLNLQHSSLCDLTRDCPFCILEKRIVRSLSLDSALDAPAKIQSCLRIFAEHFRCGRQEDAHEFLRYVIDACHNTCLRLKKVKRKGVVEAINNGSTSTSVVKEIFGGTLQSQVKCLSCGGESNKVDEIMDISLDILHSSSLKDAMHNFFQPELLDGNNKYKCENCKKLVAARKQMSILQSPNILVIQLKRFEGIFGGKIDKLIAFEEVLLLSSFMCKASQHPQPEYKLFGTIVHSGFSPDSGHYYAYIKDAMGRWYCCNDSYVSLSTLQEVLSEKVYILFYSRANQRPESANGTFASNVVKSRENGNEAYKGVKAVVPLKAFSARQSAEQFSWKNVSTMSKFGKVLSNPQQKFRISGNSGCKGFSPTNNGNDVHRSHKIGKNGAVKDLAHKEKSEKEPVINRNDSNKNKRVNDVDKENIPASTSMNENGDNHSIGFNTVKTDLREVNSTGSRMAAERGSHNTKLLNGSVYCHSDFSGSKRKSHEESCILFAQDSQSQAKVRELRKVLEEEAFSVLRSCDWSENVYSFMCSRKRVCAQEVGNTPRNFDLKKLLIADAKPTFISQIPESLKEDLIKRLSLFSKQKKESSGSSSTQVLLCEFSED